MLHELKEIFAAYQSRSNLDESYVLASVVKVEGSSYRKEGVRMLISESGKMTGAISGGCVENFVIKEAYSVFQSGEAKVVFYDGRYKLGCDGVLTILIERFKPSEQTIETIKQLIKNRKQISISSRFKNEEFSSRDFESIIHVENSVLSLDQSKSISKEPLQLEVYKQVYEDIPRIVLFGAEHDAFELAKQVNLLKWELIMVVPDKKLQSSHLQNLKGLIYSSSDFYGDDIVLDKSTFCIVMNHSLALDTICLNYLSKKELSYLGILGQKKRIENLIDVVLNQNIEGDLHFLDVVHGPVGLDIGAITPQEIAVSIVAEIIEVKSKIKKDYQTQNSKLLNGIKV